jgi:putative protease
MEDAVAIHSPDPVRNLPELLAPAGDWDCVRAAVENGADAVYFGLSRFNARLRARNFTESDLPDLMVWLHRRGVRGYVTLNTLVFTSELPEAEAYLRAMIAAGVDAVIAQDVGICRLVRRLSPDFPIHASTQMTITSVAGVEFARELGCSMVVMARENSIRELTLITGELRERRIPLPLEVFVHGALCVAYSGQCLTSEALGGRSANRGECAQACRMPYELMADGKKVELGDRRYLLSPQDLAGLDVLSDLVRAGVASLKIEGRLKSPEYVASVTRVYRAALDRMGDREAGAADSRVASEPNALRGERYELEMAFSRGLDTGWFRGIDNQKLVHGRFGKKRGVFAGEVTRVGRDRIRARMVHPLHAGDGVVFDAGHPEEPEEGGRLFKVHEGRDAGDEVELSFLAGALDFTRVRAGDRIWKTSDPVLERELRRSYCTDAPQFRRPIDVDVHGHSGSNLILRVRDEFGNVVQVVSTSRLAAAANRPLDEPRLRQQLGRLGGSPFKLGRLTSHLEGAVMLPLAELNRMRREAVSRLEEMRTRPGRWKLNPPTGDTGLVALAGHTVPPAARPVDPELIVLVRSSDQLAAALECDVRTIYCEFEDPRRYRDAVRTVRAVPGTEVWAAPPRVFKHGEEWVLRQIESAEPDGYLVRNYDHLASFGGARRIGDFSLNIANPLAAEYFIQRFGLERVTVSYDLNAGQVESLIASADPAWFEITLHQHMPMFHMEHCVFCAFLSRGKDYRDCGRPCDRQVVHLCDRVGIRHPVRADAGCRNTVFNARAQTGAEHIGRFRRAGAHRFRIEMLDEPAAETCRLIQAYRDLLQEKRSSDSLWREFRLINQLGVTRGQLGRASGADLGIPVHPRPTPHSRPRSSRSISSSPR